MEDYKLVVACVLFGILGLLLNHVGDFRTFVKYVAFGMVSLVCFIGVYWLICLLIGGFNLICPVIIWFAFFLMVDIRIDDKSIF